MRISRLTGLALAAALLLCGLAGAQTPRVEITGVRVGFPGSINRTNNRGAAQTRFKTGAWAPVYVDLEVRDAALPRGSYVLIVETTDSDDMQNVYVEKRFLPTVEPRESPTLLTYARIGSSNSEITVKVADASNPERVLRKKQLTQADINPMPAHAYGYLTVGGKTSSLYKALVAKQQQGGLPNLVGPDAANPDAEPPDPEENGYRSFANIDQVQQMPTVWFGYQPADTVILLSSRQQFATELNSGAQDDPVAVRREALAEWVRRGGRLVLSVSKNHQEVNQILEQMKIIDLTIEGRAQVPGLPGVRQWTGAPSAFVGLKAKDQPDKVPPVMEVAKLKPGPGVQVLAYTNSLDGKSADDRPIIVQAPCGLGQVIVTGFDLDEAPFTTWRGREDLWKRIKVLTEPPNIPDGPVQNVNQWGGFNNRGTTELAGKLVGSLEAFPDVPVISFGWVALFILVYILIVGPLDYFFLKKVVKRLELTWITFPAVVIVISAVAYFAAYYLKGKDLRINKLDVVDVDLHGNNVYGNTWFTLFSPRIQNYTIGVEPGPGWGAEEKDPRKYSPLVGWMGRPEEGWVVGGRGGSQGLFRRAYNYAPDLKTYPDEPPSAGLIGVPIQVWSTKTFSASWYRAIKPDELIEARVEAAKNDPSKPSGTIVSHLPVELRDVALFYRGRYYPLDNLIPGSPQRIDAKTGQGNDAQTWFGQQLALQPNAQPGRRPNQAFNQEMPQPVGSYIKSILFHASRGDASAQGAQNSSLRFLDGRWRLDPSNTTEAILFGRAVPAAGGSAEGRAEDVSNGGLSASKLWLGSLPGGGKRPEIEGTLSQETYVRVYIPVSK
jgi:hypothetical protein